MNNHSTNTVLIRRQLRPRVIAVTAAIFTFLIGSAVFAVEKHAFSNPGKATPFSRIVVLGDSLSDTGTFLG